MPKDIAERIQALAGDNRTIEKTEETKVDKRKFNKGSPQSGRKPKEANLIARGIQTYMDDHFKQDVPITVYYPESKQTIIIQRPRIVAVLEKLYQIGMNNNDADALNKWLDRALGKPKQILAGDKDEPPFKLQINIANILDRAYGKDSLK